MPIRPATIADAPSIAALIRPLAEKYIAHEFTEEGARNLLGAMNAETIGRCLNSNYRYHVAEEDGRLVGVVGVRDNKHLFHLFVAESHQRRGLARALWSVAKQACLAAGNAGEFTVNSSRFAQAIYVKLGFVAAGPEESRNGVISIPMKT